MSYLQPNDLYLKEINTKHGISTIPVWYHKSKMVLIHTIAAGGHTLHKPENTENCYNPRLFLSKSQPNYLCLKEINTKHGSSTIPVWYHNPKMVLMHTIAAGGHTVHKPENTENCYIPRSFLSKSPPKYLCLEEINTKHGISTIPVWYHKLKYSLNTHNSNDGQRVQLRQMDIKN